MVYATAKKLRQPEPMRTVLGFASAWPALVLLARPFSNSLETLLLALCFAALLLADPHARVLRGALHRQTLLLGALLALGVFARFTFVFFFFPLGVELVRRQDVLLLERAAKQSDRAAGAVVLPKRAAAALLVALQGLAAFATVSAAVVVADTLYFHPEMRSLESWRRLPLGDVDALLSRVVVAPLNNLRYNLRYENLELHGVHARVTHLAINMPLLFGLLHLQLVRDGVASVWFAAKRSLEGLWLRVASVLFPLACLSLAPHQEPRFLLPLIVPLHVFAGAALLSTRLRVVLWVAFNAVLAVFFGLLHQGGVVPMLLAFSSTGQAAGQLPEWLSLASCSFAPTVRERVGRLPLVFFKTYMPPRFLLAGVTTGPSFQVVDLAGGGDAAQLAAQLERVQALASAPASLGQAFLAAPASVSIERIVASSFVRSATRVGRCSPHLSTEDLALDKPFALELHLLEMHEPASA